MKHALLLTVLAAGPLFSQSGPKIDPTWLKSDSVIRQAEFTLVAGLTPINGGMNFNGAGPGSLTFTVPAHWTVVLHFRNNDQMLPHSAMVIAAAVPVPVSGASAAILHASTHRADQGLPSDAHEDVWFMAEQPGSYLIYCAVPGHGAAGMWVRFEVSGTARQAEIAMTTPKAP